MDNRPIGIFDSGLGGLTAVKEIHKLLPHETLIYFGDTARVPYGTRSDETIIKFALQDLHFLLSQNVKHVIIACGTVSSIAIDKLKKESNVPVTGIVDAVVSAACQATRNQKVAIMGTNATIKSKTIENAIKAYGDIDVIGQACPLLVPLIENGYIDTDNRLLQYAIEEYANRIRDFQADTIVLGCTHYPIIKKAISNMIPESVLIDSGQEVAKCVHKELEEQGMLHEDNTLGTMQFYVSDAIANFSKIANIFLGGNIMGNVMKVDIEAY